MTQFLFSIGGFIVALGILVAVHEFGHYWVARKLGVKVLRFSIGFGRPLWVRRAGPDDTEYMLAAIPLGGYVKMLDENEDENVPEHELSRAFNRQPLWKRSAIVLAGPMFNFLFAFVAYWLVFVAGVEGLKPVVGKVLPDSIAEAGGFEVGDEIVAIDGRPNRSWDEHRLYLFNQAFKGRDIPVQVQTRDGDVVQRHIDLGRLPVSKIDSALIERGVGLIGYLPEVSTVVGRVSVSSPAANAGLRAQDRITRVNGSTVNSWLDVVKSIQPRPDQALQLEIERDGQVVVLTIVPARVRVGDQEIGRIGIEPVPVEIPPEYRLLVRYGPLEAVVRRVESVWTMSTLTLKMLVKIAQLEVSAKNISGPLTIAQYAGHTARVGLDRFLLFLAVVSISLGVLNLLPIPVLDGGHLVYHLVEAIIGGPVPKKVLLWGQQIGILVLFALMSLAFYNDIVRLMQ
jgi:regulator of sigma E protease